jgi:hypothetical protein
MAETISIPPSSLLIDTQNPRLPQPSMGQREAQRALSQHLQRKILALAKHIVANGLNPADLPIVMPTNDDLKRYIVLEGNRRLIALKGLENPDSILGAVDNDVLAQLRDLSRRYQATPIESVLCMSVKDRAEARPWIELRHTGENQGAGIVPWGHDESTRFRARGGQLEIHSQALNFLEEHGHLTPEKRRAIPASSFKRLLATPEVRAKVGLDLKGGDLVFLAEPKPIAKALLFIAEELASGRTKTEDIYTRAKRVKYAKDLPDEIIVKPTKKDGRPIVGGRRSKTRPKPTRERARDNLIPRDCVLSINDARIYDIETELRSLSLSNYANSVSFSFRVFLELSVDAYITAKKLQVSEESALAHKMQAVVGDLISKQKLTKQQAIPVRRAIQRDSFLAPSLTLMHKYLHNQYVFPAAGDLRAHWNSLQPFVVAIWSP